MDLHVSPSSVSAIMGAPAFPALIEEYAEEAKAEGLPGPNAKLELYLQMEGFGALHAFSAVLSGDLVGFISLLAPPILHYGAIVAVTESFFVAKAHRGTLAGLRLLAAAEAKAAALGSPGLLVSAPYAGKLFELLPKLGYAEVGRTFFKRSPDA